MRSPADDDSAPAEFLPRTSYLSETGNDPLQPFRTPRSRCSPAWKRPAGAGPGPLLRSHNDGCISGSDADSGIRSLCSPQPAVSSRPMHHVPSPQTGADCISLSDDLFPPSILHLRTVSFPFALRKSPPYESSHCNNHTAFIILNYLSANNPQQNDEYDRYQPVFTGAPVKKRSSPHVGNSSFLISVFL